MAGGDARQRVPTVASVVVEVLCHNSGWLMVGTLRIRHGGGKEVSLVVLHCISLLPLSFGGCYMSSLIDSCCCGGLRSTCESVGRLMSSIGA